MNLLMEEAFYSYLTRQKALLFPKITPSIFSLNILSKPPPQLASYLDRRSKKFILELNQCGKSRSQERTYLFLSSKGTEKEKKKITCFTSGQSCRWFPSFISFLLLDHVKKKYVGNVFDIHFRLLLTILRHVFPTF